MYHLNHYSPLLELDDFKEARMALLPSQEQSPVDFSFPYKVSAAFSGVPGRQGNIYFFSLIIDVQFLRLQCL